MRHTARIGRTSFWAEAVGCAMGRRDSVLRLGVGRTGARERVPPEGEREPGRGELAPRVGDAELGERPRGRGRGSCLEGGGRSGDPGEKHKRGRSTAQRG
jgi:hypothetical protein